jgi:hypothetical protein
MNKSTLRWIIGVVVCANTLLFLVLAYLHELGTDPRAAIFVDFWGRFVVYSLWFIGYAFYRAYLEKVPILKWTVIVLVLANIPFFLLLAYFDKINATPQTLAFIDFWGRITVYSLWFVCYELYRKYLLDGEPGAI